MAMFEGGYFVEFDRLVACLKSDLLAIGGPGDDARSLFRDESLSRFQHMTFSQCRSMKCRTINLHSCINPKRISTAFSNSGLTPAKPFHGDVSKVRATKERRRRS